MTPSVVASMYDVEQTGNKSAHVIIRLIEK